MVRVLKVVMLRQATAGRNIVTVTDRIIFYFLALTLGLSTMASSEDFSYDRPRPLMVLSADIGEKYGLVVNYEDAPFDPVTELDTTIHPRTGITILSPKWRPITFHVLSNLPTLAERSQSGEPGINSDDALASLRSLIDQYNESGNPGRFTVVPDGDYLHIEQIARKVNGRLQPFVPVSATVVAWKSQPKSCAQTLDDLFFAMQAQHGVSFAHGNMPNGALLMHHCDVHGESLAMHQVLEQIVAELETDPATGKVSPNGAYAWQLVYDPNWNKYFLNLQAVQRNPLSPVEAAQPPSPVTKPTSEQGQRLSRAGAPAPAHPKN